MTRPLQLTFGLILTALAGYVDAIGFVQLSGLYTSFMSGNTTQLGVALAHRELAHTVMPVLLIAVFLLGSTLGSGLFIVVPAPWKTSAVLAYEAVLVFGALALGLQLPDFGLASVCMALAMGAQNAVLGSVKGFRAGTTFVTGALFSFGQHIAAAFTGTGPRFGWVGDAAVWLALMLGALAGAAVYAATGIVALIVPAVLTAVMAIGAAGFAAGARAAS